MAARERLRKKLAKKKDQKQNEAQRKENLKKEALETLDGKNSIGAFNDFKYVHFSKDQYVEFCKMSINNANFVEFDNQDTIDGYAGLIDKFDNINNLIAENKWMIYDDMFGPIKFLFDCSKNNTLSIDVYNK